MFFLGILLVNVAVAVAKWNTIDEEPIRLIAHRGERAFSIPEHSLPGYHLAIFEHADFIEPDLVMTKDGILVCYHDIGLKFNTDVEQKPEFASRRRNITVLDPDGSKTGRIILTDDWIVPDFTFKELSTLRLKVLDSGHMRLPWFDNAFKIPSFQEYLDLISYFSLKLDRKIGIIPELKHAFWHNSLFYPTSLNRHFFEDVFLTQIADNGYYLHGKNAEKGPIIVQNFEESSSRYLRSKSDLYILQLVNHNIQYLTPMGLDIVKEYANGIGVFKEFYTVGVESVVKYSKMNFKPGYFQYIESLGGFITPDRLSSEIKSRGIEQIGYTFYSSYEKSNFFCLRKEGCPVIQDRRQELFYFFALGFDGMFVENILEAQLLREEYNARLDGNLNPVLNLSRFSGSGVAPAVLMNLSSDDEEDSPIFEIPTLDKMIPSIDVTPYFSYVGLRSLFFAPFVIGFFTGLGEGMAYLGLAKYFSISFITLAFQKPVN